MPKSRLRRKMERREREKKEKKKKKTPWLPGKGIVAYPTPDELWQAVQVKSDPMLNEMVLPGTLSGISVVPETISKWLDRNCRFADAAVPPAPGVPAVGTAPTEGADVPVENAKDAVDETQKMLNEWRDHLGNITKDYEEVYKKLSALDYIGAVGVMDKMITRLQGPMSTIVAKMDADEVLLQLRENNFQLPPPGNKGAPNQELTGLDALQEALSGAAATGWLMGGILNFEATMLSAGNIHPVIRPKMNSQLAQALRDNLYGEAEANFVASMKRLSTLKSLPFANILAEAIRLLQKMRAIIVYIGTPKPRARR